ncbi:hypothetical protein PUN28_009282 [Cardiocondyla obscurior]|uniref:Uncharacterized protein n=1 Tax=Cardiocondyla obscurior TaxID=286306 RepID=A0AAW2FX14_9HYME
MRERVSLATSKQRAVWKTFAKNGIRRCPLYFISFSVQFTCFIPARNAPNIYTYTYIPSRNVHRYFKSGEYFRETSLRASRRYVEFFREKISLLAAFFFSFFSGSGIPFCGK